MPPALADCTGSAYSRSTDPWLSVGPSGTAYLSTLTVGEGGEEAAASAVQVSRSGDTGATWTKPAFVDRPSDTGEQDDKPTVAADPSRPGSVYVSWSRLDIEAVQGGAVAFGRVEFSRSRDGGRAWSAPATIDRAPVGWSDAVAQTLVASPRVLVCVFSRTQQAENHVLPLPAGRVDFYASRSGDRGRHWSHPVLIGRGRNLALQDTETSTPIRSGATPVLSAAAGPRGRVYLAWSDVLSAESSRIMLVRSTDAGRSWSHPRLASAGADRPLNPDVAVSGNGALAVRFYDLRPDHAGDQGLSTQGLVRVSQDGRRSWHERRLGGIFDLRTAPVSPSITAPGRFLGEYQGLVGLPTGFDALFAQAQPQARIGGTDGFFTTLCLAGAG